MSDYVRKKRMGKRRKNVNCCLFAQMEGKVGREEEMCTKLASLVAGRQAG